MDLSKAFDTMNYELLVANLNPYGFSKETLKFIFSYLNNRKQRVKINKRLAHGKNYYVVYHMDLCWGQFFLIYI